MPPKTSGEINLSAEWKKLDRSIHIFVVYNYFIIGMNYRDIYKDKQSL